MDKNEDFNLDFDFEKEYGFSPETIMDPEYNEEDIQFDADFLNEELDTQGQTEEPENPQEYFQQEEPEQEQQWSAPEQESQQEEPQQQEAPAEEPAPVRPRRKISRKRMFKEVYLPVGIAGVAVILMLVCIIGSISRAISSHLANVSDDQQSSLNAEGEAEALDVEAARLMAEAEALANSYDFEAAIATLDSFSGEMTAYPDMLSAKANYSQQLTNMVEWNDPSEIANLSFHMLIADPSRAFTDGKYATSYNKNFVTIDEFQKILEQLYNNGYVLVDMDDIVAATTDASGVTTYTAKSIYLPAGKTPIMITETMVDYFLYMVDSDNDKVADAGGAGFANKLVISDGTIKAELINADGTTSVGDYDLVPVLESFIASHPDFAYRDARCILAVCGSDGVLGYRTNSADSAIAASETTAAKEVVAKLKEMGYTFACYTYDNINYAENNATTIQSDLQKWSTNVAPIVGNVDILVYAKSADISEYSGNKYNVLYSSGFRYFISSSNTPYAQVNDNYFYQKRLMVTGTNMAYNSSYFTKYFSSMSILNEQRGTIPN